MSRDRVAALWQQAQARQLLPADAVVPPPETARPWPVALLTALGAWLAAVPLVAVLALAFGPLFQHGGAWLAGGLLLVVAGVILRADGLPLFVEQLAVPLLLTGGASLGFAMFQDLPDPAAAGLLGAVALLLGACVRPLWLKACLAAAAALFCAVAIGRLVSPRGAWPLPRPEWLGWHAGVLIWLIAQRACRPVGLRPGWLALATGWGAMTLLGLALSSGMALLTSGTLGNWGSTHGMAWAGGAGGVSAVLALAAAAWLARAWPLLRQPGAAGVALVMAALAGFMPALGAALLMGAVCLAWARWRLAVAAALAALWIIGSFYYQLSWPLATKAAVLAGAGLLLGLLAWPALRRAAPGQPQPRAALRPARWGAAVSLVAVLAVVNVAIVQKEALIAEGQPVFLPLAPVDPRSLMQGDYMALNFSLPGGVRAVDSASLGSARPQVVAQRDGQGVARLLRVHAGEPLAAGELLIELSPRSGRWTVVSDAWFFREGEGQRWAAARFGEFRVAPDGRALLVGLRGAGLSRL